MSQRSAAMRLGSNAVADDLRYGARLAVRDFEDAMQVAAATAGSAEVIVTRNARDYRRSPIRALTPAALLREID